MLYDAHNLSVREALKSPSGRDYLPSLPLLEAQFGTNAFLYALRSICTDIIPGVEKKLGCELCVLAFGSLGRSEFVPAYSDLDPLIIVTKLKRGNPTHDQIRDAILRPLATHNHWLLLDDSDLIKSGKWIKISNTELKYPVYNVAQLTAIRDEMAEQRRWQLLLESTPLYRFEFFETLQHRIIPKRKGQGSIDFLKLTSTIPKFFASFENPKFLYKNAFKYWKTRFLREFYAFANMLNLLLGAYLDMHGKKIRPEYLSGSTAVKIIRATKFALQMEEELRGNINLERYYRDQFAILLERHSIEKGPLLLFGVTYRAEPARLLHGMLATVLARFAACWEAIYDEHVRNVLENIPDSVNFDATFGSTINDPDAKQVIDDLQTKRRSYLRYMAAAADMIDRAFPRGRLWSQQTISNRFSASLEPFIHMSHMR